MNQERLRKLAGLSEQREGELQRDISSARELAGKLEKLLQRNSSLDKQLKELDVGSRELKTAQQRIKALVNILEGLEDTVEDTLQDLIDAQR